MSASGKEKIGVVVVHGVGATEAGWIDTYLVPELEKWRAYENVGASDRKDTGNSLVFSVDAQDRRLTVGLGDDVDFANFCSVTGLDGLLTEMTPGPSPELAFATRKARIRHRGRLRRRIANVLRTQTAAQWLAAFHAKKVPSAIGFDAASEVHRVRDPRSSTPMSTWQSFTRHLSLEDSEVQVCEFYWADLSKVGKTSLTRLSSVVQLFLESPYVLGAAFLNGSDAGIHKLIRWLIGASNWIMRWPIAGLNVAVFFTAFTVMTLQQIGRMDLLTETVAGCLAFVAISGFMTFRKWEHRKLGLSDLAFGSSISALVLLAGLWLGIQVAPPNNLASPEYYLIVSMWFILFAWAVWTALIISAVVLLSLVALKRLLIRAHPGRPPIARAAAAISLSLLLGMIWKLLLAVLGILVIRTLVAGGAPPSAECPVGTSLRAFTLSDAPADCQLSFMKALLVDISALNAGALFCVAIAVLAVVGVRNAGISLFRERASAGTLRLPRLIANPVIVLTIFAGALVNAAVFYIPAVADMHIPRQFRDIIHTLPIDELGTGAFGLVVFYFALVSLIDRTDDLVHIGRDLVDHQYDPNPKSLAGRLGSQKARLAASEDGEGSGYRRRRRIQARLEALMQDVVAGKAFDRLIFFGHSQGTVILHDYLFNHGSFIRPQHYDLLAGVKQIDVITIGSPLTHIYRYYFRDYDLTEDEENGDAPLISKVKSWTNMWRVDDPIGRNVDLLASIANVGIGPGGHQYYWKENPVCAKLWSVIRNEHPASSARAGAEAAE